jgi:hypothetical protein
MSSNLSSNRSCSRPNSANSKDSWLSVKKTNATLKRHSFDKTLKKIDQTLEKDSAFIAALEKKPEERAESRRQAAELLNKRWNDEVYLPTQMSIHKIMDQNSAEYSKKLQHQYAEYLNHNNISDGNVFLDVFDESNSMDYQPLKCKEMEAEILHPKPVELKDPLKRQFQSRHAKEYYRSVTQPTLANTNKNNIRFWTKLAKESSHIESPESQRRRIRIKISDVNRKSQIQWWTPVTKQALK